MLWVTHTTSVNFPRLTESKAPVELQIPKVLPKSKAKVTLKISPKGVELPNLVTLVGSSARHSTERKSKLAKCGREYYY